MLGLAVAVRPVRPDRPITALMYGNMMIVRQTWPRAVPHSVLRTTGPGPPHTGLAPILALALVNLTLMSLAHLSLASTLASLALLRLS